MTAHRGGQDAAPSVEVLLVRRRAAAHQWATAGSGAWAAVHPDAAVDGDQSAHLPDGAAERSAGLELDGRAPVVPASAADVHLARFALLAPAGESVEPVPCIQDAGRSAV